MTCGSPLIPTSSAVPADTLLFHATGLPSLTTKLWTGAVDNLWTNGAVAGPGLDREEIERALEGG